MPRVSKEAKAESHARILNAAARLYRERGIEATSVGEVTKAAGMTHGGFYRHFGSKDDLTVAAIEHSVGALARTLEGLIAEHGGDAGVRSYVEMYLSEEHIADPGKGCPIAALASETANASDVVREAMSAGSDRIVGLLGSALDLSPLDTRRQAAGLFANLVGAVVIARTTTSREAALDIVEGCRQSINRLLGPPTASN